MPNIEIDPSTVSVLKSVPGTVAVYRNQDLGHPESGHLKFLRIGPQWTFQEPPKKLPDTPDQINWRYLLIGTVDVEDIPEDGKVEVS